MREEDGEKIYKGSLGGDHRERNKKGVEKPCALEAAKMSALWASLSWQPVGAPPKARSGKYKESLCKTFSKRK